MKKIIKDGKEYDCFLEKRKDGAVINFMMKDLDGNYINVRHWFDDQKMASEVYETMNDESISKYATLADGIKREIGD